MIFDFFMADGPFAVFETVEQNLYFKEHIKTLFPSLFTLPKGSDRVFWMLIWLLVLC